MIEWFQETFFQSEFLLMLSIVNFAGAAWNMRDKSEYGEYAWMVQLVVAVMFFVTAAIIWHIES